MYKAMSIKFIVKLYTGYHPFWIKQAAHQKRESLRATALSKLDSMVKNKSIFNTKYAEFPTKW